MNKRIIITLATAILCTSILAQNDRSIQLNPVVVTGTGTYHKTENSPVAVKVISQEDLKNAQVTNLQDALSKLTTTITTHTNGMGTTINFNGVSDDYLLILENGKKISGDDRWSRISIDNIKRIEILSGAASALYGSEAIAGVINIITDEADNNLQATASTSVMSRGRRTQDVNLDITSGRFSSFTSFTHQEADNWQVNKYQAFAEGDNEVYKLTGRPMSTAFGSDNISQRFQWRFSDKLNVYVKGNYYDHSTLRDRNAQYFSQKATKDKITGETTYTYTPKTAYTYDLHHESYNIGAGARWVPNSNTHVYLDVYTDNYKSSYDYWQTTEKEGYDETRKRTHYYNETLKGIFRLNSWNKLSAGTELIQETLNSTSDNIDKECTYTYNIFAQDEINILPCLDAVAGLRYTYNNNFGSNVTPNAAFFFHTRGLRMRVSYAEGYRTPTLSQLYATDQAKTSSRYTIYNPDLKAEKNRFWNANAEYSNKWMSVSVTGFINNIRNMINYRTMTQNEIDADAHLTDLYNEGWTTIRQRDNIDEATIKGLSFNAKFLLPAGFSIGGGYTLGHSNAKTMTLNSKTQEYEITESPVDKCVKHVGNVQAAWDHIWGNYKLNININGHLQGERYSSTYGYAPKYQQWDIMSRHIITMKQIILEPAIGIENIFNKSDTSYWNSNFSTITPGRSVMVSLALKFRK